MASFTMTHDIECDLDRFWTLFFDKEVTQALYKHLGFPKWELVDQKEDDKEIVRVVKAQPKLEMPGAVKKVLGESFGYTETGKFDKAAKKYTFDIKPSALEGKLTNRGSVRAEAVSGGNKTKRVVEIFLEAKVFGIGGMIESITEKQTKDGWNESARYLNDWIKKHP